MSKNAVLLCVLALGLSVGTAALASQPAPNVPVPTDNIGIPGAQCTSCVFVCLLDFIKIPPDFTNCITCVTGCLSTLPAP